MTSKGFGRRDCGHPVAKHPAQCGAFAGIVVNGAGAVSVDLVNLPGIKACHLKRLFHCQKSTLAVF